MSSRIHYMGWVLFCIISCGACNRTAELNADRDSQESRIDGVNTDENDSNIVGSDDSASGSTLDTAPLCAIPDDCDGDDVRTYRDCDDADPTRSEAEDGYLYPDADGDGIADSPQQRLLCVGDSVPQGYLFSTLDDFQIIVDCNPDDASLFFNACIDGDGDGRCAWVDESQFQCTGAEAPAGWAPLTEQGQYALWDCDDADAAVQSIGYPDMDRDGIASREGICISQQELETPSTVYYDDREGDDCDDSDPLVAPYRPNVMDGSADNNCDGVSGAYQCGPKVPQCVPTDVVSSCTVDGVDLAVVNPGILIPCGPPVGGFILANLGTLPYSGNVQISYGDVSITPSGQSFVIDGMYTTEVHIALGAGEQVYIATNLLASAVQVLPIDGADCDPANNHSEYSVMQGICE